VIWTPRARRMAAAVTAAVAASLAAALPAAASERAPAVSYTFQRLDSSGDPSFNVLLGINKHGVIAGYFGSGAHGHPNAGYLLRSPYHQGNYAAESFPRAAQTQVTGINDNGVTVGFFSRTNRANPLSNANFGFYRLNGKYHRVAFPAARAADGKSVPNVDQLLGVNNSGVAAGFYVDASGDSHGYLYNIFTHHFTPENVSGGAVSVVATGISNKGDVTGYFTPLSGPIRAFLIMHATRHVVILAAGGADMTQAYGVNNSDEVVGATTVGSRTFGFTWRPVGGFHQVNDPNGIGSTIINGVNDAGDLVGFYTSANGNTNGMLAIP
jgi:hypothetical protein